MYAPDGRRLTRPSSAAPSSPPPYPAHPNWACRLRRGPWTAWSPICPSRASPCAAAGSARSSSARVCAGARTKPGSGRGLIPTSRKKGGDRTALHGAAGRQRSHLPGRDGTAEGKSHPGRQLVRPAGPKAERARQEIDYGRRGVAGYVFGAFQPASGKAFTQPYERRTTTNWVDFLSAVEAWIDPA